MKARQIAYMFNLSKEYDDAVKQLGESHTYCQGCAEGNVLQHEENV